MQLRTFQDNLVPARGMFDRAGAFGNLVLKTPNHPQCHQQPIRRGPERGTSQDAPADDSIATRPVLASPSLPYPGARAQHSSSLKAAIANLRFLALREIAFVPFQQRGDVVRHDINLSVNPASFARPQPAKPEVRVDAPRDSLEQFLAGFPGGRKDEFLVGAETAD